MRELDGYEAGKDEGSKVKTATALLEGLYRDHGGDHMAVIAYHDQITRGHGLTGHQWADALRQAQKNYHEPAPVTASREWLEQEAALIREAADLAVPVAEVSLAAAYWNGRRESYNSAREDVLANFPDRAKDLPDAIQVDQIRVRQLQEEQNMDRSLARSR